MPTLPLHGVGGSSNITHQGPLQYFGMALYHPVGNYIITTSITQRRFHNLFQQQA